MLPPRPLFARPPFARPPFARPPFARPLRLLSVGAGLFLLCSGAAFAQTGGPTPGPASGRTDCSMPPHSSATPPDQGAGSGTAPGSAGSTAWTGGTGGSHIGTTPHAPTPGSPTRQPEVVQGVDPKAAPSQGNC